MQEDEEEGWSRAQGKDACECGDWAEFFDVEAVRVLNQPSDVRRRDNKAEEKHSQEEDSDLRL